MQGSVLKDHTSQNTSEHETTRVNTSQKSGNTSEHAPKICEHESKTDEHESKMTNTSEHESKMTNTSQKFVNTSQKRILKEARSLQF
jgi:hypothetical protein